MEPNKTTPYKLETLLSIHPLWQETQGTPEICIAVIDGPVDTSHTCFAGANLEIIDSGAPQTSQVGPAIKHGTHISSIIFGQHASDVHGIAPRCRGLLFSLFKDSDKGRLIPSSQLDLARAITRAVEEGAHIINISGGELEPSGEGSHFLVNAIKMASQNGVLIIAAAGNDGCKCLHVPAALPSVLAVGAMDDEGNPLPFSNWGENYQAQGILAPGENIQGAAPENNITHKSGTSCATPIVSGVVALLLSLQIKQGLAPDPQAVRKAILESANPCNEVQSQRCLMGRLNIKNAYKQLFTENFGGVLQSNNKAPHQKENEHQALYSENSRPTKINSMPIPASIEGLGQSQIEYSEVTTTFSKGENEMQNHQEETVTLEAEESVPDQQKNFQPSESSIDVTRPDLPETKNEPLEAPLILDKNSPAKQNNFLPSACACSGDNKATPQLVYALGAIGYDFGTEARRDSIQQSMGDMYKPEVEEHLLEHLSEKKEKNSPRGGYLHEAQSIIWTLKIDENPIYAIYPAGAFAHMVYGTIIRFMNEQIAGEVERISLPGTIGGNIKLMSGQQVPVVIPDIRGMYSWNTEALTKSLTKNKRNTSQTPVKGKLSNFLDRIYYEMRNLGQSSRDRAINFSATNAFMIEEIFENAQQQNLDLVSIDAEKSSICRPGADCWDIKLTFFEPKKRLERAKVVYRVTIDVSDAIPVTIGRFREFSEY
jgi:cyanobactin maturation PatA/PatG family protease